LANRDQIPVIFLACANSYQDGKRLSYLVRERRRIAGILSVEEEKELVEVVQEGNTSKEFFFDELRQRRYKNRIAIIHFAGHADEGRLRFESEEGHEEEMNVDTLAGFLGTFSGLHLVFLNGCGTQVIVEKLLASGIPVVIATQTQVGDQQAAKVAEEFYQGIAGGYTIAESFEQARVIAKQEFAYHEVDGADIVRGLHWEGKSEDKDIEGSFFPWGLYVLKGQEAHLDWHLETQVKKPLRAALPWWRRADVLIAIAALIVSIVFGALELMDQNPNSGGDTSTKPDQSATDNAALPINDGVNDSDNIAITERIANLASNEMFFGANREETYNILLIPFLSLKDKERNLEGYIDRRLRELGDLSQLPLNVRVKELKMDFHTADEQLTPRDARVLGQKLYADMVVWGTYLFDQEDLNEIKLDILTEPPLNRFDEQELNRNIRSRNRATGFRTLPYPDFTKSDTTIQDVEDIVFWARGNEQFKTDQLSRAIDYYDNIRANFAVVHLQYANVYATLADKNVSRRSEYYKLLSERLKNIFDFTESEAMPRNAKLHYYMGLLYDNYRKGAFEGDLASSTAEANRYYSQAIKIDPNWTPTYFRRGRLYQYKLREYSKALADYNAYIQRDSTFPYVFHDRGKLFHYHLQDSVEKATEKALSDYNRVIELAPDYAWAYEDRGRLYQTYFNDPQKAKADFSKAIALSSLAYSYFYRGLIHQKEENYIDALKDFNYALKQNNQLSNSYFYRNNIYQEEFTSTSVSENELVEVDKKSVYTRLAEIYEKIPKDSLLFYKNARISIERGESIKPQYLERMRRNGRLQEQ